MGCVWTSLFRKGLSTATCIQRLDGIEQLVTEMKVKYTRQVQDITDKIRFEVRSNNNKNTLLSYMRRRKLIMHYMSECDKKIDAIANKKYALEQLAITTMHIEALRSSRDIFKTFNKVNSIEKIEELTEQVSELQADIMEVDSILSQETVEYDEDELLEELQVICHQPQVVATFPVLPDVAESTRTPLISKSTKHAVLE
tara:strand:- start:189 stop:785 length:597 start_codon:yes stop_codon:yes gene_type:complete